MSAENYSFHEKTEAEIGAVFPGWVALLIL